MADGAVVDLRDLRPWWRRRSAWCVIALPVLMLAMRLAWGWYSARELAGQLEGLRRRGIAVSVADLPDAPSLPDSKNAWAIQMQAASAHVAGVDSPKNSSLTYPDYPPYPSTWMTMAKASEASNAGVMRLARQARGTDAVVVHARLRSPLYAMMLPGLNSARQLSNTVCDGALYAHVTGDEPEALERVRDVLHVARSLRHDDFLISQLVAIGIDASALSTAQVIAAGLVVGDAPSVGPGHPATRAQVRALLGELLDEGRAWEGFRGTLRLERLVYLDALEDGSAGTWLIRPLADLDKVRLNRGLDVAAEAFAHSNNVEVQEALAARPWALRADPARAAVFAGQAPQVPRYSRWFSGGLAINPSRYALTHFRALADRRMTAVSLAAALFRADMGRWPGRLEELVPAYLPAVPVDPMRAGGVPLGYVVAKVMDGARGVIERPLVFSEGPDFVDEGAPAEPTFGWQVSNVTGQRWREIRQYRDLSNFVPVKSGP
jgi:hypothetical protein